MIDSRMATRIIIEANPRPNSIRTQVARQRAKMQRVAWAAVDLLDEALEPYSDAKATVNKLDHSFLSVRTAARDDVDHYVGSARDLILFATSPIWKKAH